MTFLPFAHHPASSRLAWLAAALAGVVAPVVAVTLLADAPPVVVAGPILATGLMGAGMIGAAAARRFKTGIALAILTGAGLVLLGQALGMLPPAHLLATGLAIIIASLSFAARGALFARSLADKGWWMAVAVVAGEAAIVATAATRPAALPDWLMVLLPAQWASTAIRTAVGGAGTLAAGASLLALAGTAAATLLVARLWPRRWPYAVMFTTWLALSALVWHHPAP
jgi:hypothetical protein